MKTGFFNEEVETYNASLAIRSSAFKEFLRSPAHYEASLSDKESTDAQKLGTAVHEAILLGKLPLVGPDVKLNTKEGKAEWAAFVEANPGKEILRGKDGETLLGVINALKAHPIVSGWVTDGVPEQSIYGVDPVTGLHLKARPDLRIPGALIDLKTTAKSAKPDSFGREIFNLGYHIQAAWYLHVARCAGRNDIQDFYFAVVEKSAPYAIAVYKLNQEALALGDQIIQAQLPHLASCISSGHYPAYPEEIFEIGLPAWASSQVSAELESA